MRAANEHPTPAYMRTYALGVLLGRLLPNVRPGVVVLNARIRATSIRSDLRRTLRWLSIPFLTTSNLRMAAVRHTHTISHSVQGGDVLKSLRRCHALSAA